MGRWWMGSGCGGRWRRCREGGEAFFEEGAFEGVLVVEPEFEGGVVSALRAAQEGGADIVAAVWADGRGRFFFGGRGRVVDEEGGEPPVEGETQGEEESASGTNQDLFQGPGAALEEKFVDFVDERYKADDEQGEGDVAGVGPVRRF